MEKRYAVSISRILNLRNAEQYWDKIEFVCWASGRVVFSLTQTALASPCNTTQGVLPVLGTSFPGSPHPSHLSSWCPLPSVPVIAHTLPWVLFLLCQLILHPLCASVSSFAPTTTRILSLLCMLSLCGFPVLEKWLHIFYPEIWDKTPNSFMFPHPPYIPGLLKVCDVTLSPKPSPSCTCHLFVPPCLIYHISIYLYIVSMLW